MLLIIRTKTQKVSGYMEASRIFAEARDESGLGASKWPDGKIADDEGKVFAKISYNGRVWPMGEWTPDSKPLYSPGDNVRETLETLAKEARCINDDDWGSERHIDAENAFHEYASAVIGINTDDLQTAKATSDEMIDEVLRRAEEFLLSDEYGAWLKANGYPEGCARELQHELMAKDDANAEHLKWLADFADRWERWEQWSQWSPRPVEE